MNEALLNVFVYNETAEAFPADELARATAALLADLGEADREVAIILLNDIQIMEQNLAHRGVHEPTDVLSYSLSEGAVAMPEVPLLGDVFVSLDTAQRQALERAITSFEEVLILVAHGVTHLLGFDHQTPEAWEVFTRNQSRMLELAGFAPESGAVYTA